jgi:hypothetical protein
LNVIVPVGAEPPDSVAESLIFPPTATDGDAVELSEGVGSPDVDQVMVTWPLPELTDPFV